MKIRKDQVDISLAYCSVCGKRRYVRLMESVKVGNRDYLVCKPRYIWSQQTHCRAEISDLSSLVSSVITDSLFFKYFRQL